MSEELKPCPFCRGKAEIERMGTARVSMIVACEECGCRVESGDVVGMTPVDAWFWNTRPALSVTRAEIEAAAKEISDVPDRQDGIEIGALWAFERAGVKVED